MNRTLQIKLDPFTSAIVEKYTVEKSLTRSELVRRALELYDREEKMFLSKHGDKRSPHTKTKAAREAIRHTILTGSDAEVNTILQTLGYLQPDQPSDLSPLDLMHDEFKDGALHYYITYGGPGYNAGQTAELSAPMSREEIVRDIERKKLI